MTDKKIKVLTLGDHPLAFSGVGIQTRNMIEGLLKSGKFQVFSIGWVRNWSILALPSSVQRS